MEEELTLFRYISLKDKPLEFQLAFPTTKRGNFNNACFLYPYNYRKPITVSGSKHIQWHARLRPKVKCAIKNLFILIPFDCIISLELSYPQSTDPNRPNAPTDDYIFENIDSADLEKRTIRFPFATCEYATIDISKGISMLHPNFMYEIRMDLKPVSKNAQDGILPSTTDKTFKLLRGEVSVPCDFIFFQMNEDGNKVSVNEMRLKSGQQKALLLVGITLG